MNNFFQFHDSYGKRNANRPYFRGTWDPLNTETYRLLPFQIEVNDSADYSIYHVKNGVETDITSDMNGVTTSGNILIYDGSVLDASIDRGICNFKIVSSSDYVYYSDDVCVGNVNGWLRSWTAYQGSPTISGKDVTTVAAGSISFSNTFDVKKGETINLIYDRVSGNSLEMILEDSDRNSLGSDSTPTYRGTQEILTVTASKTQRNCHIALLPTSGATVAKNYDMYKTYSNDKIKIKVSSSTDINGVVYSGGWVQLIFKDGNVRRSPSADITQIGDEKNGEIIIEKRISAVRYKMNIKITEQEYEALVHAASADVEITDQTGRVYNATKLELSDPTWYQNNGVIEINFVDTNNINVYTQ